MAKVINELAKLYKKFLKKITDEPDKHWEKTETRFTKVPPCINGLLADGVSELGTLNMTQFRLAAYFKSQETPIAQAIALLDEWAGNIRPSRTHSIARDGTVDLEVIYTSNRYVCRTVYSGSQYGFSCAGIKQIPGAGEYCTEECRKEIESIHTISLFDSTKAEYRHKRISVSAEVVGRQDAVYILPDLITARCIGQRLDEKSCGACPLYQSEHGVEFQVNASSKSILLFLEPSNMPLVGRIAKLIGVPKSQCNRWKYDMTEQNAEVVWIGPPVTNEYLPSERYTRQEAYFIGHGIKTNQTYIMSGYLHPNKKGIATLVFDKATEAKDSISEFEMTEKMYTDSHRWFEPHVDESIVDKHINIIDSLNYNHIYIWGRNDMLRVIDLVFHSVRRFIFQRRLIRGWLDVLIIGDSGQGKSVAAESIMNYYDLGYKTSAESSTRAGLLYGINTKERSPNYLIWGAIPRYSGRLVLIDELKEIIRKGGFSELTQARSSGLVSVDTIVSGRAMAETRLIMLTNPPGRKRLDHYMYPVEAIADLIEDFEDMRRYDMVVGVATQEIPVEEIHTDIEEVAPRPDIPAQVCKNHVLWVWSLNPEDIKITHTVEKYILKKSIEMCGKYVSDIPIVEPADHRDKIARVSAAVAARMCQEKNGKLIITQNAVDAAVDLMDSLYRSPALRYDDFSEGYARGIITDDDMSLLAGEFRSHPDRATIWRQIVWYMHSNKFIVAKHMAAQIGIEISESSKVMSWLCSYQMADVVKGGYMLSKTGVDLFRYLKDLMDEKREEKDEL